VFKKILVTGGAGFIGSNFLEYMVPRYPGIVFINFDKLTRSADPGNLEAVDGRPNYLFIRGDIADRDTVEWVIGEGIDAVVNFAAEYHEDRSMSFSGGFVMTDVVGCFNLLEAAQKFKVKRFLQVSTAEVYGSPIEEEYFGESALPDPGSRGLAAKAAADCLARAYHRSCGMHVCISRCTNNYGPYQHREKFIPAVVYRALRDEPVPIMGDGRQVRDWIYVRDHCRALELLLFKGRPGRIYNIAAEEERTNLELAGTILHILGKSSSLLNFVPGLSGYQGRCAVRPDRIKKELGWKQVHVLEVALQETVKWYEQRFACAPG